MIALSYILTAAGGALLGALLSRIVRNRSKSETPKNQYKVIPAAAAYESYAARVEGREPDADLIDPRPTRRENPFIAAIQRAARERQGL